MTEVCIQPPAYTDNVTLPAFACHMPLLLLSTGSAAIVHNSKHAAVGLLQVFQLWAYAGPFLLGVHAGPDGQRQTDRRTDTIPLHRPCSAYCVRAVPITVYEHTHTFNGPFPVLPGWASTRKVKPIWILLKQETVSGSGISWAICKTAPRYRQTTTPAPHYSVFYRPDALPVAQPTASKH